jgi:hypothetical protein
MGKIRRFKLVFFTVFVSCFIQGCGLIPAEYQKHWDQLKAEINALVLVVSGGDSPLAKPSVTPSVSPLPSQSGVPVDPAEKAKMNAELLREMFLVVYQREPNDRAEFGTYVDTLNQGASFEGVYNGFTHNDIYRQLETKNRGASPSALKAFVEELIELEAELPEPTLFTEKSALPLANVEMPTGVVDNVGQAPVVDSMPFEAPSPKPVDKKALTEQYTRLFLGASIFTMKRIIGDEALKVMAIKREYREKFAQWYSRWVVRMCGKGVDFGLALRNKSDEQFHYNFALGISEDRLQWEVLNRLHRVLNEKNRSK